MSEHISYAMRNVEATESLVYFNAPASLNDWSFLAIEWMTIIGVILAIVHAIKYTRRTGSPSAWMTLLGCFIYGLFMDIISYYTVENFWHGEFSVMFLFNKLPLYIACFYPAFMYHAVMTIRRYEFRPLTEAISVGFFGGLTYMVFDNLGPMLGWWIWDRTDPTTWPYVNSVPLTSYHWFFLFTGSFALIARKVCWDWVREKKSALQINLGLLTIPFTTCLVGGLLFVPYNIFAYNGMLKVAAFVHVLTFSAAALVFLFAWKRPAVPRDKLLMIYPLAFLAGHLYIYMAKFDLFFSVTPDGLSAEGLAAGNLMGVLVAMIVSGAIVLMSHPVER
ncbi:MAG TPA: hypothetical protein VIM96_01115 [Pseudomonadales bacterium]